MKPEDGRRVRDNMGKTKYHVACTLQRENGTPCKSLITLGTDLYRCDTGQLVRRGRNLTVRGFLSDGSEMPELNLRVLFEEYHAQVGG